MSLKADSSSIFQSVTITQAAPAAKNARERPVKVNETKQLCLIREHRDQVLIFERDFPERDTFIHVFQGKSFLRKTSTRLVSESKGVEVYLYEIGPFRENEKLKLKSY